MALTLKNYATTVPAELLQQAKKNTVRECDETEKGHFVAYVDDGGDSFDVSVTLKAGNEITRHTCECKSTAGFCRHKAALITHIANGKKAKEVVVKVGKKQSKAEELLINAEPDRLKDWVRSVIAKNKDLELSFVHYFSVKEQPTQAEVQKIVNDAVKAVVGGKRTIDATQLKKLVELWADMLTPVVEHYQDNVTDEKSFLNFHALLEGCIDFGFKVESGSNKISKFIEECLLKSVEPVSMLQVEEAWDRAVGFFINHVPDGVNRVRMHYVGHLQNIMNVSSRERQLKIIDWLARQFEKCTPDTLMNGTLYSKFIFAMVNEHDLFARYGRMFKPIRFDNEYNRELLELLIEHKELTLAKEYCLEQIKYNFRDEYNVLYWTFLRELYLIENDEENLAKILALLFPFSFNFDDYLFISKRLPEDERKKWRTKMLTRARSISAPYKKNAMVFYFKLADADKAYRKMIDYIEHDTPYNFILEYFEPMALTDKNRLMEAIIRKHDDSGWGKKSEKDTGYFPELYQLISKHYTADYLKMVIKNSEKSRYFIPNKLISYIKEQVYS
jgi:hypothetical protein